MKAKKRQFLSIFVAKIFLKWTAQWNQIPSLRSPADKPNHRRQMLDAESNGKGNDNFVAKVISTKNVEELKFNECQRVRFFFLFSYYLGQLVTFYGKLLKLSNFDLYLNKGSWSSRTIFKFMLHVIQNVWNKQGLLVQITVYNSTFYWVYLLNVNLYTSK